MLAQPTDPVDGIGQLVQYGVAGLVILALLFGWLWAKPAVTQLLEDKRKAEDQRDVLIAAQEKWLPTLAEFVIVAKVLVPLLQDLVQLNERTERRRAGGRGSATP